jgi:predicted nucleic acid-binding protein
VTPISVDASVAVKWVTDEHGAADAVALRSHFRFVAPDLITAECVNIFCKKARRGELTLEEAQLCANLIAMAGIDLRPMSPYAAAATRLAIILGRPAYDCMYLAMAEAEGLDFVTADERLLRKLAAQPDEGFRGRATSLAEAAAALRTTET